MGDRRNWAGMREEVLGVAAVSTMFHLWGLGLGKFARHCDSVCSLPPTMSYNQIDKVWRSWACASHQVSMMSYYTFAIALQVQKRFAIKEGRCKEASPFKYISTVSVRAVFDDLFRHTQGGTAAIEHLYDKICLHYLRNLKYLKPQGSLDGCRLERVTIYKRRAPLIPHESILFSLRSDDDGQEFQILVERTVELKLFSTSATKYPNDTARMVQIVAGIDVRSRKSYGESMWTLAMPPANTGFTVNLIQLLELLRGLRRTDRGEEYNVIDRNCSWLVRMARLAIIRLAQRAGVRLIPETTRQAEARLGTCSCIRLDGSKSHDLGEELVDQLINESEVEYQDFEQLYYTASRSTSFP